MKIDTSDMSLDEVVARIVALAEDRGFDPRAIAPVPERGLVAGSKGDSGDTERTSPQFVREGSPESPSSDQQ